MIASPSDHQEFTVAFRFKPVDSAFYELFSRSATQLVTGANLLAEMFSEGSDREAVAKRMQEAEHDADQITHDIIKRVNSTFVTPFDREDIYDLASQLDDCMDYMEEAVDRAMLYDVHVLPDGATEIINVVQRCAELTADSMPKLQGMKGLEEYWIEINRLENTADKHYRRTTAKLFSGQYDALEVMKYKDIVDSLESACDAFETVANVVEQIHVKES